MIVLMFGCQTFEGNTHAAFVLESDAETWAAKENAQVGKTVYTVVKL